MASQARRQPTQPKQTAMEAGQDVMSEVSDQLSAVAQTAKQQVETLMDRARDEWNQQAETRGRQTISTVRSWSDQLEALVDGRPENAGELVGIARDVQQRFQSYADSLERRGPRAFVDDISGFARRRPVVFLLGAGFAGFAIGRLVRSGNQQESRYSGDGRGDGRNSLQMSSAGTMPFDARTYEDGLSTDVGLSTDYDTVAGLSTPRTP